MSKPARNCFNYTQRRLCFSRTALVLWVRLPVGTRGQGRSGWETRPGQRPPLCPHSLSLSHSFGPCSDLRRQVQDGRGLHHHLVLLSTRGVSPGGFSLLPPPPVSGILPAPKRPLGLRGAEMREEKWGLFPWLYLLRAQWKAE